MILDTTTRKLQVVLNAALTTANMPVVVDWVDNTSTTFSPGVTPSNTNGTTLVDILAAPAASTQRKVNGITIHNLDTAAKTVLIYLNDNGTSYQLVDATLQVSDTLAYTDARGWYVMDSTGAIKGVGPTGATGAQGANGTSGFFIMDAIDGEDSFHIPGPQGPAGTAGSSLTLATAQNTTSGTSIDFTGLPSTIKRITVMFNGVSTNGTSFPQIQLGTGGGIVSTGYASFSCYVVSGGATSASSATSGFHINDGTAASLRYGTMTIANLTGNTWVSSYVIGDTGGTVVTSGGGVIALAAVLTTVRLTTVNGTDAFDAGSINIMYE